MFIRNEFEEAVLGLSIAVKQRIDSVDHVMNLLESRVHKYPVSGHFRDPSSEYFSTVHVTGIVIPEPSDPFYMHLLAKVRRKDATEYRHGHGHFAHLRYPVETPFDLSRKQSKYNLPVLAGNMLVSSELLTTPEILHYAMQAQTHLSGLESR